MPNVSIELSEFTHTALDREASRRGVSIENLIAYAGKCHVADVASDRLALRVIDLKRADQQSRRIANAAPRRRRSAQ